MSGPTSGGDRRYHRSARGWGDRGVHHEQLRHRVRPGRVHLPRPADPRGDRRAPPEGTAAQVAAAPEGDLDRGLVMAAHVDPLLSAPPASMGDVATVDRILIGRDAELEELSSLLGVAVVSGAGAGAGSTARHHVLLAGDAGVGKTRLLQELAALASA